MYSGLWSTHAAQLWQLAGGPLVSEMKQAQFRNRDTQIFARRGVKQWWCYTAWQPFLVMQPHLQSQNMASLPTQWSMYIVLDWSLWFCLKYGNDKGGSKQQGQRKHTKDRAGANLQLSLFRSKPALSVTEHSCIKSVKNYGQFYGTMLTQLNWFFKPNVRNEAHNQSTT